MRSPFDNPRKASRILWAIQGMLAVVFLFAGSMKFIMPVAEMTKQIPFSGWFLHFIGICELLGAAGLILPGLLHIREELTPLAATGLIVIMIGAVVVTLATMGVAPALLPFIVGCLAAFVAYGRRRLAAPRARPVPATVTEPAS